MALDAHAGRARAVLREGRARDEGLGEQRCVDAYECVRLSADGRADMEYFWLGRIPCRSVELVGVLVGIQVYEQRIVYTCELRSLRCAVGPGCVRWPEPGIRGNEQCLVLWTVVLLMKAVYRATTAMPFDAIYTTYDWHHC